jgi:hypothetical protein
MTCLLRFLPLRCLGFLYGCSILFFFYFVVAFILHQYHSSNIFLCLIIFLIKNCTCSIISFPSYLISSFAIWSSCGDFLFVCFMQAFFFSWHFSLTSPANHYFFVFHVLCLSIFLLPSASRVASNIAFYVVFVWIRSDFLT